MLPPCRHSSGEGEERRALDANEEGRALPLTAVDAKPHHQGEGEEHNTLEARPRYGGQKEERHRSATKFVTRRPTSRYQPQMGSVVVY